MDETGSQENAALSLIDGGPLRQVRDPGGLESEGLIVRSGNTLRGRLPQTNQMSSERTARRCSAVVTMSERTGGLSLWLRPD